MNYTVEEELYIASDGYVFKHKTKDIYFKQMKLGINDTIENYEVIEEPIVEEPIIEEAI